MNNRWLGGMLTNFRTVRKSVERFKEQRGILENEEKASELSKRDRAHMAREVEKYRRSLEGIQDMGRLPDAMFVIDVGVEHIAISEARRLGIPIVAVVDTNCNPDGVDFVVPGNDDAIRAIQLYCSRVADACIEGAQIHNERLQSQATEGERVPRRRSARALRAEHGPRGGRDQASAAPRPRRNAFRRAARGRGPGGRRRRRRGRRRARPSRRGAPAAERGPEA